MLLAVFAICHQKPREEIREVIREVICPISIAILVGYVILLVCTCTNQ